MTGAAMIPAYQETAVKRVLHEARRAGGAEPLAAKFLEVVALEWEQGRSIDGFAGILLVEVIRQRFELAMKNDHGAWYRLRSALGLNDLYSLSHLDSAVWELRNQLQTAAEEAELWKDRWEAEHRDHLATIEHCDEVMREGLY